MACYRQFARGPDGMLAAARAIRTVITPLKDDLRKVPAITGAIGVWREAPAPTTRSEPAGNQNYSIAIGYLRAVINVGVVAIHSVLAHCSFAPLQNLFG